MSEGDLIFYVVCKNTFDEYFAHGPYSELSDTDAVMSLLYRARRDAERLECGECKELRVRVDQLETALMKVWTIAVHELTCQSRLSAAQPGTDIARVAYDALGKEVFEARQKEQGCLKQQ